MSMGFFRGMKEKKAFRAQLSSRAFELYDSFCVWRGMMDVESNVAAMVAWANNRFREAGGFILDDFNAMLRNDGQDAVGPQAPVTAEMFEAIVGWFAHSSHPEFDIATQSFQSRDQSFDQPFHEPTRFLAAPASSGNAAARAEAEALGSVLVGLSNMPNGLEYATVLLQHQAVRLCGSPLNPDELSTILHALSQEA